MAIGAFSLVVLFGLANSQLPHIRTCDPVQEHNRKESPTVCSNYKNVEFIYGKHKDLEGVVLVVKKSAENNNAMLERLERTLNNALAELTRSTETQSLAFQTLRNDVDKLVKQQERVQGNLSNIEQRLNVTERRLVEKKEKLESLEKEAEAAFNHTTVLLSSCKVELSLLDAKSQELEVQLENRLNVTKMELGERLEATDKNTEAKIVKLKTENEASFNGTKTLLNSYKNQLSRLNSTTLDLGVNLESRLSDTKRDLENQLQRIRLKNEELTRSTNNLHIDVTILRKDVNQLEKHQERFGGNFSDVVKRLDVTERQLMEKKTKLDNLETETEAAFSNANILLDSYKKELSHLKSTTEALEVKVEARLNITKMNLENKLETTQKNNEAFSAKLHNQKTELDHKIERRFNMISHELKTQNITMYHLIGQTADRKARLQNLEKEIEASFNITKTSQETYKNEHSHLNLTVQDLEDNLKVKLEATKTDLGKKLEKFQETTEAKIATLKMENEASFNNTKTLLNLYKNHLSQLNSTTQDLRVNLESQLNDTKMEFEDQSQKVQSKSEELTRSTNNLSIDVTVLRKDVDQLERHQERFGGNFSDYEKRLDALEGQLMEKKAKFANLEMEAETAFNNTNILLDAYKKELSCVKSTTEDLAVKFEAWLNVTKTDLDRIQKKTEGQKKVAFSATIIESFHSFTGPYSSGTSNVLKFDRVFTNIGNAYNKKTGVFTAPVNGVYQFSFMTFGYNSHTSGAILVKNGHYQVSTWEFTGPDASDTTSNTVILELNAGDCVNVILWQGGKVHTSVFSGFLIFPLV